MHEPIADHGLSAHEQDDFAYVVWSAKRLGWIDCITVMTAEATTTSVAVHASAMGEEHEAVYDHNERWIYKLMSDLSQRRWRNGVFRVRT